MGWGRWDEKTRWRGGTVDYCTKAFFVTLEKQTGMLPTYYQLSYNKDVAASGGTHDGGSIADTWVPASSREVAVDKNNKWLRKAKDLGGMGWRRFPPTFPDHCHNGPLAGPNPATELILQWRDYDNNGNGLYPYTGNDDTVNPYRADVKAWGKDRYEKFLQEQAARSRLEKINDGLKAARDTVRHLLRRKRKVRRQLKRMHGARTN